MAYLQDQVWRALRSQLEPVEFSVSPSHRVVHARRLSDGANQSTTKKPKVAVIGTGGTITSISGIGPLDLYEYTATGKMLEADQLVDQFPGGASGRRHHPRPLQGGALDGGIVPRVEADRDRGRQGRRRPIRTSPGSSSCTAPRRWRRRPTRSISRPRCEVPIVVVGAQRPASALSTDAGLNLVNAVRTAAAPEARGLGVLVCLNDEIQAAREVTKTSTARLQTFRTPDFGVARARRRRCGQLLPPPGAQSRPRHRVRHPPARCAAARRYRLFLCRQRRRRDPRIRGGRRQGHRRGRLRAGHAGAGRDGGAESCGRVPAAPWWSSRRVPAPAAPSPRARSSVPASSPPTILTHRRRASCYRWRSRGPVTPMRSGACSRPIDLAAIQEQNAGLVGFRPTAEAVPEPGRQFSPQPQPETHHAR